MSLTTKIGKSNIETKKLGLGTNKVGGHNLFPNLDDEEGQEVVQTAIDSGIEMIDTAFAYGLGRSEELIGEVLAKNPARRKKLTIATKAAQDPAQEMAINNDPEFLKQAVHDALKRLQTDYIDIFYIHFPDKDTPKDEAIGALHELKEQGLIRAIGVSNFSLEQLKEANKDGYVDIVEDRYNLLHREAEDELFPYLRENNISFVPFFPLASGLLTGKYHEITSFADDDIRSQDEDFQGTRFERIIKSIQEVQKIADAYGVNVAQLILAWYIKNPDISVVIPGARVKEQVVSNMRSLEIILNQEDYDKIDNLFQL
ncbi:aldo/keto reductase [Holzapfeliella floricola]|uniref:Aldo keto reductase n=1 Tax=Holzapfeliella floricola DSM 23037 = JCM 16512 TaxID=1423744 RepID=A0A0R2DWM7_9LACO|nr:aldo/keto reductase [Holzapfeliella floricola]KRN04701.1 aldo keto reductase [Holzapfeliella floricola DSM 23037 = JCM 16512]